MIEIRISSRLTSPIPISTIEQIMRVGASATASPTRRRVCGDRHERWLRASIAELEGHASRRESQRFSKKALYKASAMRSRLAALDEQEAWSKDLEAQKASFLRRKLEQGRRFDSPREDPSRS